MDELLQHGLNALMLGGTYALLGIGLTLIFGIMKVVNFTHGELYAFGAYMMYALVMLAGVSFFVALPLAIALGILLGALLELVLLRRLRGADRILLDNRSTEEVRRAVAEVDRWCGEHPPESPRMPAGAKRWPEVEVSGGIRLDNVRAYAETGADYVSVGALTHSAPALDLSLEVEEVG